jgi:hypothetical protein
MLVRLRLLLLLVLMCLLLLRIHPQLLPMSQQCRWRSWWSCLVHPAQRGGRVLGVRTALACWFCWGWVMGAEVRASASCLDQVPRQPVLDALPTAEAAPQAASPPALCAWFPVRPAPAAAPCARCRSGYTLDYMHVNERGGAYICAAPPSRYSAPQTAYKSSSSSCCARTTEPHAQTT